MAELLTVREVAEQLQLNPKTVYRYLKEKRLKGVLVGPRTIRVRSTELAKFLAQKRSGVYYIT